MPNNKEGQKKKKTFLSHLITIVCLAVFVYAAHGLLNILFDYYRNDQVLSNLQEIYYQDAEDDMEIIPHSAEKRMRSAFENLKAMNDEVVGWITIDETKIDYPILQASNNTDFLDTNFYGEKSIAGSIFMDYRNDITLDEKNFILYGHRMKDGSMFQHLTKYLDREFFEAHRTFTIDTLYDRYEAEIFAVYNTMIDFNYIETEFESSEQFDALIDEIKNRSLYQSDLTIGFDDQMITLSTCEYTLDPNDSRLVVHAKLTKVEG